MAFQVKVIDPLDLKPQTAIGVSVPFNGPAVFNSTYTTQDQLKSNMTNFLLTNFGERVFNPDLGGNLRRRVFEQISGGTLEGIKSEIEQILNFAFHNISVGEIQVLGDPDSNSIFISVKYSVPSTNVQDELQINFN